MGATMEEGRSDLAVDPGAVARLRAAAAGLYPHLADAPARAVGRACGPPRPDGLPLVGPSRQPAVLLARAPGATAGSWPP